MRGTVPLPFASAPAASPPRPWTHAPREAPRALVSGRARARTHQARRVLVVDDDPDILATLSATLEAMLGVPVAIETASSGDEAKRRIERGERFDLVMTDERMPGLRGSELLD